MSDSDILSSCKEGKIAPHNLEKTLGDFGRAVSIRRQLLSEQLSNTKSLDTLPHEHFDYSTVFGACAENVIG